MNAEEIRNVFKENAPCNTIEELDQDRAVQVEIAAQLAEANELRREQIVGFGELIETQNSLLKVTTAQLELQQKMWAFQMDPVAQCRAQLAMAIEHKKLADEYNREHPLQQVQAAPAPNRRQR